MKKYATLLALYFAQGLPFGFQAGALPLLLRERGVSLQAIGFASVLAAPWMAKALWAPLVDRYGSVRFGRRKSWIIPMQAALAVAALLAARTDDMVTLTALIFVMNACAATQDIATDGLAVSWLQPHELGPANAIQVVGYKLGMLTGGGLLVTASGQLGWSGVFYGIAALMTAVLLFSLTLREHDPAGPATEAGATHAGVEFSTIFTRLRAAMRKPEAAALIAVVLTYKMGESLADAMWKPMLIDRGFSAPDIGLWAGTYGMLFSLAGTTAAGLLIRRIPLPAALLWTAGLRALGIGAEYALSLAPDAGANAVILVTCVEHLFGGAITTVLFALMMRHTDRKIGATHYTLLASLEVWGKLPFATLSGVLAANAGYPALFGTGTALSIAFALLVAALHGRLATRPAAVA